MQHARCQPCKPPQTGAIVKITDEWRDALCAQTRYTSCGRREGNDTDAGGQQACSTQADVAATDYQNALPAKARGQRTKGT